MTPPDADPVAHVPGNAAEVFRAFLRLGLTSFGGPIAHIAYFRTEFVERRGWLDEARFAQLLVVCQFLPGPASSQMGFAIGLFRAGAAGALAAFLAFTLPSALLMFGFAGLASRLGGDAGSAVVHGLKLVAVVVVGHGLLGMARRLTPDVPRAAIALAALALVVVAGNAWAQLLAIAIGGALGTWWCRNAAAPAFATFPLRHGRVVAIACLLGFVALLAGALALPASPTPTPAGLAAAFYRAGALVFGGGHVVLPLLEQAVVDTGWVAQDAFLAGYGAAQAVPGPMFSLAAFLGADAAHGMPAALAALIAVLAVFLPGFLLLLATLPAWSRLSRHPSAARAVAGVNAAVVGLLAAAFHDPVWTQAVRAPVDLAIAAIGFAAIATLRLPALAIVAWCVAASVAAGTLR